MPDYRYNFKVKNASLTAEEKWTGTKFIISCYGLDMNDDYKFDDADDSVIYKFVKDHMNDCPTEILAWNENEELKNADSRKMFVYLENHGVRCTRHVAQTKEHFDSWFKVHEEILDKVRSMGRDSMITDPDSGFMWVHSAKPFDDYLDAWCIYLMSKYGVVLNMFTSRVIHPGCGSWFICMDDSMTAIKNFLIQRDRGVFGK